MKKFCNNNEKHSIKILLLNAIELKFQFSHDCRHATQQEDANIYSKFITAITRSFHLSNCNMKIFIFLLCITSWHDGLCWWSSISYTESNFNCSYPHNSQFADFIKSKIFNHFACRTQALWYRRISNYSFLCIFHRTSISMHLPNHSIAQNKKFIFPLRHVHSWIFFNYLLLLILNNLLSSTLHFSLHIWTLFISSLRSLKCKKK